MLTAYYDESGTHGGSPITVLGGFVGDSQKWAEFEREWRKVLVKNDLRFVRAKQLFHRQGPYRHWPEKNIRRLWADLLYVLQEHKGFHVSKMVLPNDVYDRSYISDGPSRHERLDTKYALCVRCAMHLLPREHHRLSVPGAINFILEAGHKNAGDALRVFAEMKERDEYPWAQSIGAMSFGAKQDFPALQAADLISYWFYKTEMEKLSEEIDNPYNISFLEMELAHCGLQILEHVITPLDLTNLRQNFLAKQKRVVFDKVRMVAKAGDYIAGAWDTPSADQLFGAEFSAEQVGPNVPQTRDQSRLRR